MRTKCHKWNCRDKYHVQSNFLSWKQKSNRRYQFYNNSLRALKRVDKHVLLSLYTVYTPHDLVIDMCRVTEVILQRIIAPVSIQHTGYQTHCLIGTTLLNEGSCLRFSRWHYNKKIVSVWRSISDSKIYENIFRNMQDVITNQ